MEMNKGTIATTEVFKLAPGDIDHLFRRSGRKGNRLSPFRYNADQAAISSPSQWFKELADSHRFNQVVKRLLEPDLKLMFRTGGGGAADDKYNVLLSTEDKAVLGQFTNSQGDLLLLLFVDWEAFLQWWTSVYSSEGTGEYRVVFPDRLEIEVLVCMLHCLDIYHRSYMESMLDYRDMVDISITTQEFVQLLKQSLASADKRWLLPALFELTPGLKNSSIALSPDHLKKIEELGFVTSNENLVLTMAERAKTMGTEFMMTWMGAVGWQATALINGEEKNLSRVFLAPTAFANHLFSFETGANGETRFRHQANTGPELIKNLVNWMESIQNVTGIIPSTLASTADSIPARKFCGQCGSEIRPGKKFCTSCGSAL